jgi:asparagine synthase (glutamine-hydrolysing)
MCGIIGIVTRASEVPDLSTADVTRLAHRGPDDRGLFRAEHVALGHSRLSIIDLSEAGRQPMTRGRLTIVFNGEIYNYVELRKELATGGADFRTATDTEVILAAYERWGASCVERFRGMFAIAIWDEGTRTVFLARDRCGEKPLLYWTDGTQFCFASEVKAILPLLPVQLGLDPIAVDMFLHYQFVPEPLTPLVGLRKLPAGHTLTLSLDADLRRDPEAYWCIEECGRDINVPATLPAAIAALRETFEESVRLMLRSDVPVGVALSGGIDSGAIAAVAQRNYPSGMHAFSIGYPGRPPYDERNDARRLAESLGMAFHEVEIPVDDFSGEFPAFVRLLDEPIADPAAFGHYAVPKAAREAGIKVLLSGIGGDELFWGYKWVRDVVTAGQRLATKRPGHLSLAIARSPLISRMIHSRLTKFLPQAVRREFELLEAAAVQSPTNQPLGYATHPEFRSAARIRPEIAGPALQALSVDGLFTTTAFGRRSAGDIPEAVIRMLCETWLTSNCLALGDRVSMAVGVETRLPLLDPMFIGLAAAIRRKWPDHTLGHKARFREALAGILPQDVLTRPKRGFTPPVGEWFRAVVTRYGFRLAEGPLVAAGLIDPTGTKAMVARASGRSAVDLFMAYKLTLLDAWYSGVASCPHR